MFLFGIATVFRPWFFRLLATDGEWFEHPSGPLGSKDPEFQSRLRVMDIDQAAFIKAFQNMSDLHTSKPKM